MILVPDHDEKATTRSVVIVPALAIGGNPIDHRRPIDEGRRGHNSENG